MIDQFLKYRIRLYGQLEPILVFVSVFTIFILISFADFANASVVDDEARETCKKKFPEKDDPLYSFNEIEEHCKQSKKNGLDASQTHVLPSILKDATVAPVVETKELNAIAACKATWIKVRDLRLILKEQNREKCIFKEIIKAKTPTPSMGYKSSAQFFELGNIVKSSAEKLESQNKAIAEWPENESLEKLEKNNFKISHKYLDNLEKLKRANQAVMAKHQSTAGITSSGPFSACSNALYKEEVNKTSQVDLKFENVKSACDLVKNHGNTEPSVIKSRLARVEKAEFNDMKTVKFESPLMQEQVTAVTSSREFKEEVKQISKQNDVEIQRQKESSMALFNYADQFSKTKGAEDREDPDNRNSKFPTSGPGKTTGSSIMGSLPLGTMLQAGVALAPLLMQKDEEKAPAPPPPKAASPKDVALDTGSSKVEATTAAVKRDDSKKGDGTSLTGYTSEPINTNAGFTGSKSSLGSGTSNTFTARISKVDGGSSGAGAPGSLEAGGLDKSLAATDHKKGENAEHPGAAEGGTLEVGSGSSPAVEGGSEHASGGGSSKDDTSGGSSAVDDLLKTMENSLNPNKEEKKGEVIADATSEIPNPDSSIPDSPDGPGSEVQSAKTGDQEMDVPLFLRIRKAHIRCLKTGCLISRIPKKLNSKLEQEDAN